ncbi:testis-expressed protein 2-like [Argiope bruennichi]|uniref:Testis-expressed protein 2 like protein n=1 Tax=Argiope bruennichi TaxID=94029 RepID=A0A8T0EGA8_ARGBR|nr:testis-expressed protein 2-like [Argiope bruennichi]KAF8771919.1 Testis-expressed protein 2 like protein [Argiope bruennichi]
MNKSFRNIHGSKSRSSSTTFISLHFNKADEEQLEISYGDKGETASEAAKKEENIPEATSASENKCPEEDISDNDENLSKTIVDKDEKNSRESTPGRDSVVKEYWSRISKRASSVDSDMGIPDKPPDPNEGWMFFKDIKGKLTKTLEERKSSISKSGKDEKGTSESDIERKDSCDYMDPDRTPTETAEEKSSFKLSPAIEAAEVENEDSVFAEYIDDKLERAKCEIISTKTATSSSQFFLKHPPKPSAAKMDISMTLSTLMANRQPSMDIDIASKEKELSTEPVKIEENVSPPKLPEIHTENELNGLSVKIRRCYYFIKTYWNTVIFRILVGILGLLFVPVPSWICGFIAGAVLSGYFVYFLFKPGKPKEAFVLPDFSQPSPSNIPVTEVEDEVIIYKGWMNILPYDMTYNPDTYHVNCTRSLFIRLDGSYLRVSFPQKNIPKRAMFNEPRHEMQFVHQQHYDITGSSVELLPVGLAKKRLWSKKYPICLRIPNHKQSVLSNFAKDAVDSAVPTKTTGRKESPVKKYIPRINENNEVVLYLFARTDREKDLWHNRFKKASRLKLLKSHSPSSSPNIAAIDTYSLESKRTISIDLASLQLCSNGDSESLDKGNDEVDSFTDLSMSKQEKFKMYMSHLMNPVHHDHPLSLGMKEKKDENSKVSKSSSSQSNLTWLNVLLGRIFFDFLTEDMWAQLVAEKIQRKLSKIKLPVFLKELTVKDINLGTALPKIHRASEPSVDQRGLWIDIDLSYNGFFQMTLETKINLLRYKCASEELSLSEVSKETDSMEQILRSPVYNSEEEDSAESSSDEDVSMLDSATAADESAAQLAGGSTGKKLLRLVDRFAQSTYFQQAAKNKYIKKAMEDISNTPLVLTVEVQWLTGTLAINIPPMPTDRLWYGFRTNPHLSIVARPKLGHHVVTLTHVTEWIEKKLVSEFQKILVMPNMDDLIIPIMQSDLEFSKA